LIIEHRKAYSGPRIDVINRQEKLMRRGGGDIGAKCAAIEARWIV